MNNIKDLSQDISDTLAFYNAGESREAPAQFQRIVTAAHEAVADRTGINGYLSRILSLLGIFADIFPEDDEIAIVRAPGRINLIGEHTDYNGLPVLPMAIDRDIIIAASRRQDKKICVHNMNGQFEPREFEIAAEISPYPQGDWGNYAKAAAQTVHGLLLDRRIDIPKGFNAVVGGSIPMANGLASSSALVVAFSMALLSVNGLDVDRHMLAGSLARGEQYVGTRGGGMDQTVCLLARPNHALKIDFFPLHIERIPLPEGYSFVVCNSLVSSHKSIETRFAYNLRVVETRIAAAVLNKSLTTPIKRLGDLRSVDLALGEAKIESLLKVTFRKDTYSPADIAHQLDMGMDEFRQSYLGVFNDDEVHSVRTLRLLSRCRHVASEGRRVREAAKALRSGDMETFGNLMYESHKSCANDYEVSIPELDALVAIARDAGALGSRLTGAGFGGCTISVVRDTELDEFIEIIEDRYYRDFLGNRMTEISDSKKQSDRIFVCASSGGSSELFL